MFEFEFKGLEMNNIGKSRWGKAKKFEFEFKGLEMNNIGKSRWGEAKKFAFEFKGLEMNNIGKSRWGEAKKFEFEFKGLEINNIGKLRCEKGNVVSRAQRSGPLLLVIQKGFFCPVDNVQLSCRKVNYLSPVLF